MRHLDLFSGIGGFSLAASWVWGNTHDIVAFCEKDTFCQKVLAKHWPDVPCVEDIHNLRGDEFGTIDLITGGFPCQPFSQAGKQSGKKDDRYLWPEMLSIIEKAQPRWVIGENVIGIVNLVLDDVLSSLEGKGYEVGIFNLPACAVNAPHQRQRIWIVAYSGCVKLERPIQEYASSLKLHKRWTSIASNSRIIGERIDLSRDNEHLRRDNGVSHWMDRIRSLGNAIVPHVATFLMTGIKQIDDMIGDNNAHEAELRDARQFQLGCVS